VVPPLPVGVNCSVRSDRYQSSAMPRTKVRHHPFQVKTRRIHHQDRHSIRPACLRLREAARRCSRPPAKVQVRGCRLHAFWGGGGRKKGGRAPPPPGRRLARYARGHCHASSGVRTRPLGTWSGGDRHSLRRALQAAAPNKRRHGRRAVVVFVHMILRVEVIGMPCPWHGSSP